MAGRRVLSVRRTLPTCFAGTAAGIVLVASLVIVGYSPASQAMAATHKASSSTSSTHHTNQSKGSKNNKKPKGDPTTTTSSPSGTTSSLAADMLQPPATTTPDTPALVLPQAPQGQDQEDPVILHTHGRYYLYTSQSALSSINLPVTSGTGVGAWGPVTDALPTLPAWAAPGLTWAPEIHQFGSTYVLYYTAIVAGTQPAIQCIGDATSSTPTGPFVAQPNPFICQLQDQGSIDPRVFTDANGTNWMVWKSDNNANGSTNPTAIWTQPLSANGLQLLGSPTQIFAPDEPWQGTIVEAPDLVESGGQYWLFYSANWFNQPQYGIGVASCAGPQGPCHDLSDQPLVSSNLQGIGPGEESVFIGTSGVWMLYGPWRSLSPAATPPRPVAIVRIGFGPLGPYIGTTLTSVPPGGLKL